MTTWYAAPRDFVMVHGPDAATYLQSQLSQEMRDLAVGQARWTFLLQPAGRVDVLARVLRSGEHAFVLDTDEGYGDVLLARLQRFKIRVKADVEPIAWVCTSLPLVASAIVEGAVAVPSWWGRGIDLLGPAHVRPAQLASHDHTVHERLRVEAGWPAMGHEIVPGETIPGELPMLPVAVSFTKGCYPGQELVERMDSRAATAPRLVRRVVLPYDVADVRGAALRVDGEPVGTVTTSAGDLALASVRRTLEPPVDAFLAASGGDVAVRLEAITAPA
jgi:folate-binding protein YgfZ